MENYTEALTDEYYGEKCKIIFKSRNLSQQKENKFIAKYPNYKVREIGHQSTVGYVYVLAIFNK